MTAAGTPPTATGDDAGRPGPESRESGQVTLFILGFCAVLMVALAGVAASSSVYLTRRALSSVADGAAVAAADAVSESDVIDGVDTPDLRIDGTAAQEAAARSIELSGAASTMTGFSWSGRLDGGGRDVVVTATATADIPLASALFGRGVPVTVTARSTGRD